VSAGLTRRRVLGLGAAAAVLGAPGIAYALGGKTGPSGAPTAGAGTPTTAARRTAKVTRRDLAQTVKATGTLGYGDHRTVRGPGGGAGAGTITALPAAGAVIGADQPLYGVDGGEGPILVTGALPLWRTLQQGVDDGADVAQVEAWLVALGHADAELTVDETFSSYTAKAVKAWQQAHGLPETGRLEPAAVWWSPAPVRVASVLVGVGDPATGDLLTVTATGRLIRVDLAAKYATYAHQGDTVGLELADGTKTTGTISRVATTATVTPGQNGQAGTTTVAVEVTPTGPLDALDESPVTVAFTSSKVAGALAVPVDAVVATADGRYALEVVSGATTGLVEVTLGRFADGWVQVTGAVSEGQTVVSA
jgi:peptidoglycan hydrolase-like protein with peptidoglycan-binding domain